VPRCQRASVHRPRGRCHNPAPEAESRSRCAKNSMVLRLDRPRKICGSFGRLVVESFRAVLRLPDGVFIPLGTKHENRTTQKQCKGVKETFHPYTKMWV